MLLPSKFPPGSIPIAAGNPLGRLGADNLLDLVWRPGVGEALDALGVRVFRRGEAALGQAQHSHEVVERLLDDAAIALLPLDRPRVQVDGCEQRVVVEHLLEVRHEPDRVDGVAVEAAAELVVDAAGSHPVERDARHAECVLGLGACVEAKEQFERRRGRELGRAAEAAVDRVELRAERRERASKEAGGQRLGRGAPVAGRADRVDELLGLAFQIVAAVSVYVRHRSQHLLEARHAHPRLRREVRAAPERPSVGGQENRHRPTAVSRERHDRLHVEPVDVGALLAVDLDGHEALVHESRRLRILERLVLHDVTPVASGVADGEKDRLVLCPRPLEGLVSPRVPVDRVIRVLEEVRARLSGEAVHPGSLAVRLSVRTDERGAGPRPLTVSLQDPFHSVFPGGMPGRAAKATTSLKSAPVHDDIQSGEFVSFPAARDPPPPRRAYRPPSEGLRVGSLPARRRPDSSSRAWNCRGEDRQAARLRHGQLSSMDEHPSCSRAVHGSCARRAARGAMRPDSLFDLATSVHPESVPS